MHLHTRGYRCNFFTVIARRRDKNFLLPQLRSLMEEDDSISVSYHSLFKKHDAFHSCTFVKALSKFQQSEKFLDLGTVTRAPSNIYARVNCSVIRDRCTRVQGHPRNLFQRPWIFGLSSRIKKKAPQPTIPRQRTLVFGGKLLFSSAAAKIPKAISQKRHDGFSFLNDENLDKCVSKKKISLATPALWLSSPHWAKCMTNSYPCRSPSKRHAKPMHSYVGAPSRACT